MTKKFKIASPASFNRTEEIQLPSQVGTEEGVLLRKPDVSQLISTDGNAPDVLSNMVVEMLNDGAESYEMRLDENTLPGLMNALDRICIAAFVEPKCWTNDYEDEEHFPVKWLSLEDKQYIFAWAMGGEFSAASSFPERQPA